MSSCFPSKNSTPDRANGEQGAIIVIVALIVVPIIILGAILFAIGYQRLLRTRYQTVSDAAAQAAASTLCSTRQCYDDAPEAAAKAILANATSDAELARVLVFDGATRELVAAGPEWGKADPTVTVTIQRGHWWSTMPNSPYWLTDKYGPFEPYDPIDPPAVDPNVPVRSYPQWLAANAVRVEITRKNISMLWAPFGGGTHGVTTVAYALGGQLGKVRIAPFAIPVCRLLDETGEFNPKKACRYDRYITAATRYCPDSDGNGEPDNPLCNLLPGSWYSSDDGLTCGNGACAAGDINCDNDCRDLGFLPHQGSRCSFETPASRKLVDIADHYALIGLPATSPVALNESSIRDSILKAGDGLVDAEIGEEFRVLTSGFTESATMDVFWDSTTAQTPDTSPQSGLIPTGKAPNLTSLNRFNYWHRLPANDNDCDGSGGTPIPPQIGACNSHRIMMHYGGDVIRYGDELARVGGNPALVDQNQFPAPCPWCNLQNGDTYNTLGTGGTMNCDENDMRHLHMNNTTSNQRMDFGVWQVAAAVIAPETNTDCFTDPAFHPAQRQIIIGFVPLDVYDADIGIPPPAPPTGPYADGDSPIDDYSGNRYGPLSSDDAPACDGGGKCCTKDGTVTDAYGRQAGYSGNRGPWGFTDSLGNRVAGCNMLRAKIDCNTMLVPSKNYLGYKEPGLIELPLP